ncbi:MAG: thiamine pyrophosphate-binding protein, partial [Planctomycetia bacterium]|nr:thiamine pyrophosphate-binding protein [Planctomycetia bacterium]
MVSSKEPLFVPKNGADVVVSALIRQGVDVIFAYPGGYSMPLHQAFMRQERRIRVVLPRQEQGGGFAAQGYARTTGRPGVCMTTSGPGATNLVTTIADAKLDSVPVVFITGQVVRSVIGTDAFQEVPMTELCRSITKHHYLVTDPADLPRIIREAFYIATTGRPGPVLIDIPRDVQLATVEIPDPTVAGLDAYFTPEMNLPGYTAEIPRISEGEFARMVEMIRTAKRPVICAGGGIISADAATELTRFAEKTGIPVTTTLMGLGGYASNDPENDP